MVELGEISEFLESRNYEVKIRRIRGGCELELPNLDLITNEDLHYVQKYVIKRGKNSGVKMIYDTGEEEFANLPEYCLRLVILYHITRICEGIGYDVRFAKVYNQNGEIVDTRNDTLDALVTKHKKAEDKHLEEELTHLTKDTFALKMFGLDEALQEAEKKGIKEGFQAVATILLS